MNSRYAKIGAAFYLLWGLVHIAGGVVMLQAARGGVDRFLQTQTGNEAAALGDAAVPAGAIGWTATQEVFSFHSFNLIWLGMLACAVAVFMNWRNSRSGYWINMALVGFTDLGLIWFIVVPGVLALSDAWIGPVLFAFALWFSTKGKFSVPQPA